MTPLYFLILCLATWRFSMFLSEDDLPYGIARKLREWLSREARKNPAVRKSEAHKGIQCLRCSSTWCGMLIAHYAIWHHMLPRWVTVVGYWAILFAALSGASIIFTRIPEKK